MRGDPPSFQITHDLMAQKLGVAMNLLTEATRLLTSQRGGNSAAPVRVLCIDESADTRALLRMLISAQPMMECTGCLASEEKLAETARSFNAVPDVVILDAPLTRTTPSAAVSAVNTSFPGVKTIIHSVNEGEAFLAQVRLAGAWACVSKNADPALVLDAVRQVASAKEPIGVLSGSPGSEQCSGRVRLGI